MTRTLRERLAAQGGTPDPPARADKAPHAIGLLMLGQLVRVAKPTSGLVGMTGTVEGATDGKVGVRLTAWGRIAWFAPADLVPVERGGK